MSVVAGSQLGVSAGVTSPPAGVYLKYQLMEQIYYIYILSLSLSAAHSHALTPPAAAEAGPSR